MIKKIIAIKSILVLAVILTSSLSWGSNGHMVEKRIMELDSLNKKVVLMIDIPQNGSVDLKARVYLKRGELVIDIIEKKIETIVKTKDVDEN